MKQPNETGDTCDVARSGSELANRLAAKPRKINRADLVAWRLHGKWMFNLPAVWKSAGSARTPHSSSCYSGTLNSMNADEVKQSLATRAEEFVRYLFPAGRKSGKEWLVGSLTGEGGEVNGSIGSSRALGGRASYVV